MTVPPRTSPGRRDEVSGVQVVVLLARCDDGAPDYGRDNAPALAAPNVPGLPVRRICSPI